MSVMRSGQAFVIDLQLMMLVYDYQF